jgi:hypothetical protein
VRVDWVSFGFCSRLQDGSSIMMHKKGEHGVVPDLDAANAVLPVFADGSWLHK